MLLPFEDLGYESFSQQTATFLGRSVQRLYSAEPGTVDKTRSNTLSSADTPFSCIDCKTRRSFDGYCERSKSFRRYTTQYFLSLGFLANASAKKAITANAATAM